MRVRSVPSIARIRVVSGVVTCVDVLNEWYIDSCIAKDDDRAFMCNMVVAGSGTEYG